MPATRISVALILESLAAGMSIAEKIVDAYPSLSQESIRGVLLNWLTGEISNRCEDFPRQNLPRKLIGVLRAQGHQVESAQRLSGQVLRWDQ